MALVLQLVFSVHVLIRTVNCHGSVMPLVQKLNNLDSRVLHQEIEHQTLREELYGELEVMEVSLREELLNSMVSNYVEKQVMSFIQNHLTVNSLDKLLNSHVMSEIRHTKKMLRTLKTQNNLLTGKVAESRKCQSDRESARKQYSELEQWASLMELYSERKGLIKSKAEMKPGGISDGSQKYRHGIHGNNRDQSTSNCSCVVRMRDLEYQKMELRLNSVENEGEQSKTNIGKLESSLAILRDSLEEQDSMDGERVRSGNQSLSHLQMRMQEARSRIILVPFQSPEADWKEFLIHRNVIRDFPSSNATSVNAIAIDAKRHVLFIATFNPLGIFRSELDKPEVTLLKEDVRTYGIDVDSEKQLVFFTMHTPKYAICRMKPDGTSFTPIIDLSSYGSTPWALALDEINERIYATTTDKLLSVSYNGTELKTIFSGRSMYSLTLDYVNNDLYFNDDKVIRRVSVSSNVSSRVTHLAYTPRMFVFYSNTLYIGGGKRLDALYFYMNNMIQLHLKSFYKTYIGTYI